MRRLILTAALLIGLTAPAWADFESGLAAYIRGDYETALREFTALAEQGKAEAQFNLGVMYHIGEGVPRDYVQAMQWHRLAAEQEHIGAQYNLGLMYAKGQGVSQDYVEAANWYRRAAEQNDGISQSTLGIMYTKGYGVPQDFVRAHMWLSLAASNLSPGRSPRWMSKIYHSLLRRAPPLRARLWTVPAAHEASAFVQLFEAG